MAKSNASYYQSGAYSNVGRYSSMFDSWSSGLLDLFRGRFGGQSDTFNILNDALSGVVGRGGRISYDFPEDADQLGPIYDVNGNIRGQQLTPDQQETLRQAAQAARNRGDERTAQSIESDPFGSLQRMSGYDPSLFQPRFQPRRFQAREQAALRSEASEQVTNEYQDAAKAFGTLQQQLGGFGGGVEAQGLRDLQNFRAAREAEAQRDITKFGSEQLRTDYRTFAPLGVQLQLGQADALAREAESVNAWNFKIAQMRQAAAAERARASGMRAMARAAEKGASAAARQRAFEFAQEMQLKGKQLESQNFFNAVTGLGSLANMQNPLGYAELISGALGTPGGWYTNIFGSSAGQASAERQARGQGIGGLFGALGGIGSALIGLL